MQHFNFHNVTISIPAISGQDAYTKLCNALDKLEGEWWTDSYTIDDREEERSTTELFPE